MKIIRKEIIKDYQGKVYNIGVQGNNNYFANDVLVHNCYTSAKSNGVFYEDICETWKKWSKTWYRRKISGLTVTNAPTQIAIGSGGSSDEHGTFIEFLKTVRESGVIPNYTTAGRILGYLGDDPVMNKRRDDLIEATEKYCSAVAISLGNLEMRDVAFRAIENLRGRDVYITLHHIISDEASISEFFEIRDRYGKDIHYHVLLPLVAAGRSTAGMKSGMFDLLQEELLRRKESGENISNIAFGAKFIEHIDRNNKLGIMTFPEQSYSKNVLLKKDKIVITPSSFDLKPIKIIDL